MTHTVLSEKFYWEKDGVLRQYTFIDPQEINPRIPYKGAWVFLYDKTGNMVLTNTETGLDFPGGGPTPDEKKNNNYIDTLRREALEETGLKRIKILSLSSVILYERNKNPSYLFYYTATYDFNSLDLSFKPKHDPDERGPIVMPLSEGLEVNWNKDMNSIIFSRILLLEFQKQYTA